MKSKSFFEIMGEIDEDLIERSEKSSIMKKQIIKWIATAACFGILCAVSVSMVLPHLPTEPTHTLGSSPSVPTEPPQVSGAESSTVSIANQYTITYELDGGIEGGNAVIYHKGDKLALVNVPMKPGYDFTGWTGTGLEGIVRYVSVDEDSEGDLSFTAVWTQNKYDHLSDFYSKNSDAKTGDMIQDILNGSASVMIAYSEDASPAIASAAEEAYNELRGIGAKVYLENKKDDISASCADYKFIFGKTGYENTDKVIDLFKGNDYAVIVYSDMIVIGGGNERAIGEAYLVFYEILEHIAQGGHSYEIGLLYSGTVN